MKFMLARVLLRFLALWLLAIPIVGIAGHYHSPNSGIDGHEFLALSFSCLAASVLFERAKELE